MRISDWSSDVCSSDLGAPAPRVAWTSGTGVQGVRQAATPNRIPVQPAGSSPVQGRSGHLKERSVERAKKEALVAELHQTFEANTLVVVTHQKGLTVAEVSELRRLMRDVGARSEGHTSEPQSLMRISYA